MASAHDHWYNMKRVQKCLERLIDIEEELWQLYEDEKKNFEKEREKEKHEKED